MSNKILLKEKDFELLYNALVEKLRIKYRENGIRIKDSAIQTVWTKKNGDNYFVREFLEEVTKDPALLREIRGLDPGLLYRHSRTFITAKEGIQIDERLLNIFMLFLGEPSISDFLQPDLGPVPQNSGSEQVDIDNVTALVHQFYDHITDKNFEGAWNLLSNSMKMEPQWNGEISRFIPGYDNFIKFNNLAIFNCNLDSASKFSCMLYYEDETKIHLIKHVMTLATLTIDDIDEFCDRVKKLRSMFEDIGLVDFEETRLRRLFDPAFSEYVSYKYKFSATDFHALFPKMDELIVRRLYRVSCILVDQQWKINSIQHFKTHTVRGD
jgi:hypothetical protein